MQGSTSSSIITPSHDLAHTFKFKDYAPEIFYRIREHFQLDQAEYQLSLCGGFNYIEFISNSKSGQFFFYSHDGRFMIKTQTKDESKFLRRILPHYYRYVINNPNTLLTRFYGMHRVKMHHLSKQMHFVIMASVFDTDKAIHHTYDLKGSLVGRWASEKDVKSNGVLKDCDLEQESGAKRQTNHCIELGEAKKREFLGQLRKDSDFLAKLKIMDYSLLLGIHDSRAHDGKGKIMRGVEPSKGTQQSAQEDIIDDEEEEEDEGDWELDDRDRFLANTRVSRSIFQRNEGGVVGVRTMAMMSHSDIGQLQTTVEVETGCIYFIGIIDILQQYNTRKRGETFLKGFVEDTKKISSVAPRFYAQRFVAFLDRNSK